MLRPVLLLSTALIPLFLTGAPAQAADALILKQRITAEYENRPREQMQYFTPTLRVTDDERGRSIIDLAARKVTFINKVKQTYVAMTFEEMETHHDRHDDRVRQLPGALKGMIRVSEKVTAAPTGRTERIAGQTTREYKVESSKVSGSVWLAPDLSLGGDAAAWAKVSELLGGTTSPGGQLDLTLSQLGGLALRRSLRIDPLPLTITEVVEISRGEIPEELTEIPDGYTQAVPTATRTMTIARPTKTPGTPKPTRKRTPKAQ